MNKVITSTELHTRLSEVLKDAIAGTPTIVTFHGMSVAAVVPLKGELAYTITEALLKAEDK